MVGPEPHLKWKTFVSSVQQLVEEMNVSLVLSLGGVLAAVPHTQPVRLTGTALSMDMSRAEGDTAVPLPLRRPYGHHGRSEHLLGES